MCLYFVCRSLCLVRHIDRDDLCKEVKETNSAQSARQGSPCCMHLSNYDIPKEG